VGVAPGEGGRGPAPAAWALSPADCCDRTSSDDNSIRRCSDTLSRKTPQDTRMVDPGAVAFGRIPPHQNLLPSQAMGSLFHIIPETKKEER